MDFDILSFLKSSNPPLKEGFIKRIVNNYSYFSPVDTVNHMFSYSSSASEVMDIITELYHNAVITLGYVLYIVIAIILLTIYYFNSRVNLNALAFNRRVEYLMDALFVMIPIIIIYCLCIPAVGFILTNDLNVQGIDSPFNIEIVGHQWYWTYYINANINTDIYSSLTHYLDSYNSLLNLKIELEQIMVTDIDVEKRYFEVGKYVILPAGETIRCELTSVDVVHSWAIPQLGIKVDAIPGRVQTFYLRSYVTGAVYGQCSEFCGENHAFMPIVIEFVEISTFIDWVLKSIEYNPYAFYLNAIITSL